MPYQEIRGYFVDQVNLSQFLKTVKESGLKGVVKPRSVEVDNSTSSVPKILVQVAGERQAVGQFRAVLNNR